MPDYRQSCRCCLEGLVIVDLLHPTGDGLVRVLVRGQLRLAIHDTLEIDASQRLVRGLEPDAERALRHARNGMLGRAQRSP